MKRTTAAAAARTDPRLRAYVEKVGVSFEQLTLPRMAGRIFGWLLVCEPPEAPAGELVTALHASKSSVSTMVRLLMRLELIELVSLPGERRDLYRIRSDVWMKSLEDRLSQAKAFRRLAREGLELLSRGSAARRRRLEDMEAMYAFLEIEIPLLVRKWQREHRTED
jgi:DNA-binding transcriptional regulator GbsR (MarR family)